MTWSRHNLTPLLPLAGTDAANDPIPGEWNKAGWTLFFGGLFLAAWSTYAFETAICYTNEFKNPRTDTFKAIFASGLLCLVVFSLVPFSFQGTLGLKAMLDPGIYDGSGVAAAMARMVGGGTFIGSLIVIMLILAVILSIITAMAGSSRTLYQGSADGWLPKYLSHVNRHGAPTPAMWTNLGFNLILLLLSDYVFVLAVSNCCYFSSTSSICMPAGSTASTTRTSSVPGGRPIGSWAPAPCLPSSTSFCWVPALKSMATQRSQPGSSPRRSSYRSSSTGIMSPTKESFRRRCWPTWQ